MMSISNMTPEEEQVFKRIARAVKAALEEWKPITGPEIYSQVVKDMILKRQLPEATPGSFIADTLRATVGILVEQGRVELAGWRADGWAYRRAFRGAEPPRDRTRSKNWPPTAEEMD
jgi:hypothetical protein